MCVMFEIRYNNYITNISSIGHNDTSVTALIEWQKQFSESCTGFSGGCFKYPLVEMQKLDTDLGLPFYITLHVFNKAGHAVTVRTEEFTLPSMHAPAKTIIFDINPESVNDTSSLDLSTEDIDAHFSTHRLCAEWNEFSHHGDIQLAFGAGTAIGQDDVYAFTEIGTVNKYCVTSLNIPLDVKIFVSIRATSTGGVTVSSSDGVIIHNETRVLEQLNVLDGPRCITPNQSLGETVYGPDKLMTIVPGLREGIVYTLRLVGQNLRRPDVEIQNFNFHVERILDDSDDHTDIIFQPYSDTNELVLPPLANTDANATTVYVYDCVDDIPTQMNKVSLEAHWSGVSEYFTYETAAIKSVCNNNSDECIEFLAPYTESFGNEVIISGLSLDVFGTYHVAVRPCLNSKCLNASLSTGVSVGLNHGNDRVQITKATLVDTAKDCSDINIIWEPLYHNSFYKWTVMAKVGMSKTHTSLIPWQLKSTESSNTLTVSDHALNEIFL